MQLPNFQYILSPYMIYSASSWHITHQTVETVLTDKTDQEGSVARERCHGCMGIGGKWELISAYHKPLLCYSVVQGIRIHWVWLHSVAAPETISSMPGLTALTCTPDNAAADASCVRLTITSSRGKHQKEIACYSSSLMSVPGTSGSSHLQA